MADLTELQAASVTKIAGANSSTGSEDFYVDADSNGNMKVIDFATAATGSAVPTNSSFVGARNPSGNLVGLISDASSNLFVNLATAIPAGTNIIGKVSQDTSPWITKDQSDGPVAPGAAASFAQLIAGQYSTSLPVLTTGQQAAIQVDSNGRLLVSSQPLPTTSSKFSFGDALSAATALIPVSRTAYNEVTASAAMTLVSSSANDASAGTGARTVQVTYLDATMAGPFFTTFTMNGTTAVTAGVSNMCYIEKIQVLTVGSAGANAGTLALKSGAATVGTVNTGDLQSFWCHHYVPTGKTTYISGFSINSSATTTGSGANFILKVSTPTVANTPEIQISDFHRLYGQQSSTNTRNYLSPIQVSGPARVRAYVAPETTVSNTYRASFDYIDN